MEKAGQFGIEQTKPNGFLVEVLRELSITQAGLVASILAAAHGCLKTAAAALGNRHEVTSVTKHKSRTLSLAFLFFFLFFVVCSVYWAKFHTRSPLQSWAFSLQESTEMSGWMRKESIMQSVSAGTLWKSILLTRLI